ncbi:MAG: aminotransferase class V-fold PLP-dependent enzyme [Myxococcota bacterium]
MRRALEPFLGTRAGPLPSGSAAQVVAMLQSELGAAELPEHGIGAQRALRKLGDLVARFGVNLNHPAAIAHLQPPPLAVAVAADTIANLGNASLDTFDSGPTAIAIERWTIEALAKLAGFADGVDGVMTPGGSISNLMGLLLARDAAAARAGQDARMSGTSVLSSPVVFCSEVAHFSVHRACATLGLGETAVRTVPVTEARTMDSEALSAALEELKPHETPVAIVATAGTTDYGTIDPLREIARLARLHGVWLHVDAAYGFGALFSSRLAPRVSGISLADSVTLDLHKLGWQPAAASILLVSKQKSFGALSRAVDYLNPKDDAEAGYDGLLGRSLQTTRRADAIKVAATLMAHGRRGLGEMVDTCHGLARYAERQINDEPRLALEAPAELTTVLFRFRSKPHLHASERERLRHENEINAQLRRDLLESGQVLIGRTTLPADSALGEKRVSLKFTFINPLTSPADIDAVLKAVVDAGIRCERRRRPVRVVREE